MTTPRRKPFLVVSDLHLDAVPAETERRFRAFLDYAASEASGLLINGDLFEFGIAYRSVVPRGHVRVLAKLADIVESGVPVYFVAGNRDRLEWGGHVLEEDAGVTLITDPTVMEIAGRRALITHGDGVGPGATRARHRTACRVQPTVRRVPPPAPSRSGRAHPAVHDDHAPSSEHVWFR